MPDVKKATGKVSRSGSKYVVTVGKSKFTLPVGTLVSKELVSGVVGKEVEVTITGKTLVGISSLRPPILCYVPVPDLFREIEPRVQEALRKVYVDAGILER